MTYEEYLQNKQKQKEREKELQILQLKRNLQKTDYQAIKYAEGELTEEEFAPIKAERKAWRAEINALEEELKEG